MLAAGCGSKGGSSLTVADFCQQKAEKECGTTSPPGVAALCVVSNTACVAHRTILCNTWAAAIQTAFPTTRPFVPGRVSACTSKAASVYQMSPIVPSQTDALDAVCELVFSGAKVVGDPCTNDFECDQNAKLICDTSLAVPVCAKNTPISRGAFCGVSPGQICGPAFYCTTPVGQPMKMCVDKKAMGETCDAANPCIDSLRCGPTGICTTRVGVAVACATNDDCSTAAPYCDPYNGSVCDPGFSPSPGTPECMTFGATGSTPGAGGGTGTAGATGSAGGAGGSNAGGASGTAGAGGAGGAA